MTGTRFSLMALLGRANTWVASQVVQVTSGTALTLQGPAGTDATIQEWKNGAGTVVVQASYANTDHGFLNFPSNVEGKGPVRFSSNMSLFNGTPNLITGFGYNQTSGGTPILAGEPGLTFNIEGDYNDGSNRYMEAYLQIIAADGVTYKRPWFVSYNRATDRINAFQIKGQNVQIEDDQDNVVMQFNPQNVRVIGSTTADTQFYIKAGTGRGATLNVGSSAGGDTSFSVTPTNGNTTNITLSGSTVLTLHRTPLGGSGAAIAVGTNENGAVGTFAVMSAAPVNQKGIVVRGRASQNGNLFEAQDSASAVKGGFNKAGYIFTALNAAPADADISAGQCFFWFDSTNGAAKFMIKGKSANGTVVSGEVALA